MGVNVNIWNLMYSMRSVSKWQETINSNINGAVKTGYKEADIMFGGNTTSVERTPTPTLAGKQIGEQVISTGYTRNIWKQGEIMPNQTETDYAIRGEGFFMLTENDPYNAANAGQKIYYTKNGKFHLDYSTGTPRLRADNGLFVVDRFGATQMGLPGVTATATPITSNLADTTLMAVGRPPANDNLTYSKFGSTIFQNIANNNNIYALPGQNGMGDILHKALEASNVNLGKQIATLSSSKQLQEAITKQFLVFFKNIDVGIELIK